MDVSKQLKMFAVLCSLLLMQSVTLAQTDTTKQIVFPEVEGWKKGESVTYPTPELGYSLPFQSAEGGTVTIYVYNGGNKVISTDPEHDLIKNELKRAKNDIKQAGELGYYENVKEIKDELITLGGGSGKVKSHRSLFTFTIRGIDVSSEIYLFSYNNNFIKIRTTRPIDKEGGENEALMELLSEIDILFSK